MVPDLLLLALDYHRAPLRYPLLADPGHQLPECFADLFGDMGAALAPPHLEQTARRLQLPPSEIEEAVRFFARHVLLDPAADHYRTLGLSRDARPETVRQHYHMLIRLFHPDRAGPDMAADGAEPARLNTAYRILRDPQRRSRYDAMLGVTDDRAKRPPLPLDAFRPNRTAAGLSVVKAPRARWRPTATGLVFGGLILCALAGILLVLLQSTKGPALRMSPDLSMRPVPLLTYLQDGRSTPPGGLSESRRVAAIRDNLGTRPPAPIEPPAGPVPALPHKPEAGPASTLLVTAAGTPPPSGVPEAPAQVVQGSTLPPPARSAKSLPPAPALPVLSRPAAPRLEVAVVPPEAAREISGAQERPSPPGAGEADRALVATVSGDEKLASTAIGTGPDRPASAVRSAEKSLTAKALPVRAEPPIVAAHPDTAPRRRIGDESRIPVLAGERPNNGPQRSAPPLPQADVPPKVPAASTATRSREDPAALIDRFVATYERGDLDGFVDLFTANAQVNEGHGQGLIRSLYADLFNRVPQRRLVIGPVRWRATDPHPLVGEGGVRVGSRPWEAREWHYGTGTIRFELVPAGDGYRIAKMLYELESR